jgi:2-oxoglutarate dehydrogenase E1 component
MGGWSFIRHYLSELLGEEPRYVGRKEAASPAVGSPRTHREKQENIINEAFNL